MKKIFVIITLFATLVTLSSCSFVNDVLYFFATPEEKLEMAFEKLSETSYTMEGSMRIDMTLSYLGETQKQTFVVDMHTEANPNEIYNEEVMNGETQRSYIKINDDEVLTYTEEKGKWTEEVQSLEKYKEENANGFLDIDIKDAFTLEDGIWVGNVEVISEMLEETTNKLSEDLLGDGAKLNSFELEKYNIEMENNEISKVDIAMSVTMTIQGVKVTMKMSVPMTISKVGQTDVTVPVGLNITK